MRKYLSGLTILAFAVVSIAVFTGAVNAGDPNTRFQFDAQLSEAQTVAEAGLFEITTSTVSVEFDKGLTEVKVLLKVKGGANVTKAHFHCAPPGVNGAIVLGLFTPGPLVYDGKRAQGTLTNADVTPLTCEGRIVNNIASLAFAMRDGSVYANVHTSDVPAGEVRGQLLEK